MPTEEEWCAIIALANKAHNAYGSIYDTDTQYTTVMEWARKWTKQRKRALAIAKKWNKEHPEKHREHNRNYARRNRVNYKEYQHNYYMNVVKPNRQAQRKEYYGTAEEAGDPSVD